METNSEGGQGPAWTVGLVQKTEEGITLLTLHFTLDGAEWLATSPGRLTPGNK